MSGRFSLEPVDEQMIVASRSRLTLVLAALVLHLSGCMDHYLIHPDRDPPGVVTWSEEVTRGPLRLHLEWSQPRVRSLSHGDRPPGRRRLRRGHEGSRAGPRAARLPGRCGRLLAAARW